MPSICVRLMFYVLVLLVISTYYGFKLPTADPLYYYKFMGIFSLVSSVLFTASISVLTLPFVSTGPRILIGTNPEVVFIGTVPVWITFMSNIPDAGVVDTLALLIALIEIGTKLWFSSVPFTAATFMSMLPL